MKEWTLKLQGRGGQVVMWWAQSASGWNRVNWFEKMGGGGANAPSVPSVPPALSNDLQRHMLAVLPSNVQDEFKTSLCM